MGEQCGSPFSVPPSCPSACFFQAPLANAAPLSSGPVQTTILLAMIQKDTECL